MRLIDLTGRRFGRLRVIGRNYEKQSKYVHWNCLCDCGNLSVVDGQNLRSGHTKSCGHCERFEPIGNNAIMCKLPTGRYFIFDAVDTDKVKQHRWTVAESGYVETTSYLKGESVRLRLHRIIVDAPDEMVIDHINGNRWDNRRCNLRIATPMDNSHNHKLFITNSSGYTGVSYEKRRGKYAAYIHVDGRKKHLGYFNDPKTAAKAYDQAAVFYYGEFASPNFKEVPDGEILEMETA